MLGHLGSGQAGSARAVWERFAAGSLGGRPPGLALEVLKQHALATAPRR